MQPSWKSLNSSLVSRFKDPHHSPSNLIGDLPFSLASVFDDWTRPPCKPTVNRSHLFIRRFFTRKRPSHFASSTATASLGRGAMVWTGTQVFPLSSTLLRFRFPICHRSCSLICLRTRELRFSIIFLPPPSIASFFFCN